MEHHHPSFDAHRHQYGAMCCAQTAAPLVWQNLDHPALQNHQIRIRVRACGVCRTDLHVIDGDLPDISYPIVLGHEIVGIVEELGSAVTGFQLGDRVGVPWLGATCGRCEHCLAGRENLCDHARFHGYTLPGGFAQYVTADAQYSFLLPRGYSDVDAAPLLCAGLIGYRAYKMAGPHKRLGIYGFGAAAHIVVQLARHHQAEIYAFTRQGDTAAQEFALGMGANWAGDSNAAPPHPLDAAILFAPVGELVPAALASVRKGGTVVCAGIHMSDIPSFPYRLLWGERTVRSVANLTRADAEEFLAIASTFPIQVHAQPYPLADANRAVDDLRHGRINGAAVLTMP